MSAIELATLARYRIPAIVVVFDNKGYGTERPMPDGPCNDVAWQPGGLSWRQSCGRPCRSSWPWIAARCCPVP